MTKTNLFTEIVTTDLELTSICISTTQTQVCYQALLQLSAQFAHYFNHIGLKVGDSLIIQADKSVEFIAIYLACLRSGIIFVPLDPILKFYHDSQQAIQPLDYYIDYINPKLMIIAPEKYQALQDQYHRATFLIETLGSQAEGSLCAKAKALDTDFTTANTTINSPAAIVFTSGTTGKPKGVVLTQGNLISNAQALVSQWQFSKNDVMLHVLPIHHAHGLFVAVNTCLLSHCKMLFEPGFDCDRVLNLLPASTVFMGYPAYYTQLLNDPRMNKKTNAKMRLFTSGSAPLLTRNFQLFQEKTGLTILERYGMSETIVTTSNPYDEEKRKIGSIGKILPSIIYRLVDRQGNTITKPDTLGRLELKGDSVFSHYWQLPEKTKAAFTNDGYLKTGDLVYRDTDDYLYHMGRESQLIYLHDEEICPRKIEMVANELPGILESTVVAVNMGELSAIAILLVANDQTNQPDTATIKDFFTTHLPATHCPELIIYDQQLPRNRTGKVDKQLAIDRIKHLIQSN